MLKSGRVSDSNTIIKLDKSLKLKSFVYSSMESRKVFVYGSRRFHIKIHFGIVFF